MPSNLTRIKNNQITDSTIQAGAKLAAGSITGNLLATTVTFNSNITILGNLTVSNSYSQLNSVNTYINDPIVVFNNGYEGSPTYDIGILVNRNLSSLAPYGAVNAALVWKEADTAFEGIMTTETGTTAGAINTTGYANLKIGNITGVSSTISGISAVTGAATFASTVGVTGATTLSTATAGGLQAQAIGNVTPGTGVFTTFTSNLAVVNYLTGGSFNSNVTLTGHLIPSANITYNLGDPTHRFGTLYLSGNIILLGGTTLEEDGAGGLTVYGINATRGNITTLQSTNFSTGNAVITGGSVNGAPIGASSASTGAFTTGTYSSTLGVTGATTLSTATTGGLQAQAIGNVTPGTAAFTTGTYSSTLAVTGATTLSTATTGGLQAQAIGNVTPGSAAFTTGTFSSTVGVTGATTLSTATTGGLQAQAIGNVTPGTGAFTTGTYSSTVDVTGATTLSTATTGGLQAQAIGNVTPGTAAFTTGTFSSTLGVTGATTLSTATAGGVQAQAIGNVTPGTGAFTTLTASGATTITDTTESTSAGTGALIVSGGVGIAKNLNVTGSAIIGGNLTVQGTLTAIQSTTLDVSDLNITVAKGAGNAAIANGAGITVDGAGATILYTNATDTWNLNKGLVVTTGSLSSTLNVTGATTLSTATTGGLQAQAIGNVTPGTGAFTTVTNSGVLTSNGNLVAASGTASTNTTTGALVVAGGTGISGAAYIGSTLGVTGATTLSTATTGGLQAQAIGNVTPGTGAFTTGTFSSTVDVTGATTLSTATTGGLQAQAIGNVTPGTGAFTTTTAGGLQAQAIGNVTPGSAAFTTGTFSSTVDVTGATTLSTATTGGLQAQAIGNVTPGTAAFTTGTFSSTLGVTGATTLSTATAGGVQAQAIGNVTPGTGNFTTVAATNFSTGNAVITGGSLSGIASVSTTTLQATNFSTGNAVITGGSVNGATIGASSASTGAFTTITGSSTIIAGGNIVAASGTDSSSTTTGALVVVGGIGASANVFHGKATTMNSTQVAGGDTKIQGVNDSTLLWARPSSAYDQVLIGNSATVATLVRGAKLQINSTDSILLPAGTNAQRPGSSGGTDTAGMFRFSTTATALEVYDGAAWSSLTSAFTVITDENFNGDSSAVDFTMAASSTTAATIVSINGILQIPTLAYSVSGTTLTFTEAPQTGDLIDVRRLSTTATVTQIASVNGYMSIQLDNAGTYFYTGTSSPTLRTKLFSNGAMLSNAGISSTNISTGTIIVDGGVGISGELNVGANVTVTGNVLPSANVTYNLGSPSQRWKDLWLSGNTIDLAGATQQLVRLQSSQIRPQQTQIQLVLLLVQLVRLAQ